MIAVLLAGPAVFGILPESPADRLEQNEGGEVTPFGIDFEHIQGDGIDDNKRQVVIGSNNWYTTIFKLTKYVTSMQAMKCILRDLYLFMTTV